jgi:prokaryotic YEATS domain
MKSSKPLWETVKADPVSRALGVVLLILLATLVLGAYGTYLLYSDLRAQRREHNKRISELSAEVEQYKYELRNVSTELTTAQRQTLSKSTDAALLQSKIQVNAACEDRKEKGPNSLELYNFSFSLTDLDEVFRRIKSVDYFLDHPSFRQKDLISTDPLTNFQKSYKGWGCLDSVLVKITFDDPSLHAAPIDFNQCKSLQNQSCSER